MKINPLSRATLLLTTSFALTASVQAHPGHAPMENFNHGLAHTAAHYAVPALAALAVAIVGYALFLRPARQNQKIGVRR